MTEPTKALAIRNDMTLSEVGSVLARSGFFADSKDAAQAVVKVLAGAELGLGPVASMTGIYIVKGRVTLSANLIAGAIKRSGRYNFKVIDHTDKNCSIDFYENGEKCGNSTFSADDAKRAQLGGDNWTKYPRNMLYARAMSNGAKWYCPDVFAGGIYTPEELGEVVDGETGEVVDVKPTVTHKSEELHDPTAGLYTLSRTDLSDEFVGKWTDLVKKAMAAGVVMNFSLTPEDDTEVLKDRIRAIKTAIENTNHKEPQPA